MAHAGRLDEANLALGQIMSRLHITEEAEYVPFRGLTALLEIAVLVGNRAAAELLAKQLAVIPSLLSFGHGTPVPNTSVARHLGAAAALLGDKQKAKAYYQQALEACAKIRFRPEAALTRLQLAELLLEEAEDVGAGLKPAPTADALHKEAIEHLDFAIAEFQAMKMQPALERALRHKGILKA
ncbi:MAG: hypothetical protein EXR50_01255 [Dehalococcoidia bacterium]|nr:hypothetical protein [Dehalococcoidia bacterium]